MKLHNATGDLSPHVKTTKTEESVCQKQCQMLKIYNNVDGVVTIEDIARRAVRQWGDDHVGKKKFSLSIKE